MQSSAQKLMQTMTATKVSFSRWGLTRKVTPATKQTMADAAKVKAERMSANKKIADAEHPAIKKLTEIRGRIEKFWKALTNPYVEDGVRLLPSQKVSLFAAQMEEFRAELKEAAADLQT